MKADLRAGALILVLAAACAKDEGPADRPDTLATASASPRPEQPIETPKPLAPPSAMPSASAAAVDSGGDLAAMSLPDAQSCVRDCVQRQPGNVAAERACRQSCLDECMRFCEKRAAERPSSLTDACRRECDARVAR
jgi:hypothetical protein